MSFLVLTPGDPDGIGPEIAWKALRARKGSKAILCVGARAPFDRLGATVIEADPRKLVPPRRKGAFVWLLPAPTRSKRFLPGFQAGWSIETATRLVLSGQASALVTGPISKERLQKGGYPFPGHTEFLASLCGAKEVTMMLANDQLRVSLATIHLALKDVPRKLGRADIRRAATHTVDSLRKWWGIRSPRIAITALNPHAGESGLFGDEERRILEPEIRHLQSVYRGKATITGPHPADTFFAKHLETPRKSRHDAVICMYHDQGLIPVKLLDFHRTVNVTLGLPIVRTSVDHGVGFDIAGKGIANPASLESAIELATRIARNRSR